MLGVYLHFPYCLRRCPYCDFAVAVRRTIRHEEYRDRVLAELRERAPLFEGRHLVSIYLGGGTPALWAPACVAEVIAAVRARFPAAAGAELEVTIEGDPARLSPEVLAALRAAGVNRLSLGVQSFDDAHLQRLGRLHDGAMARDAVRAARAAGFENLSLDLMIGLCEQREAELDADLDQLLQLGPEHVSLYQLTIEPRTVYHARRARGELTAPDSDTQAAHYQRVRAVLAAAGYQHYEISSFARPGRRAVHNQLYWTGGEYLGLGAGAHSFRRLPDRGGERSANARGLDDYLQRRRGLPLQTGEREVLDAEALAREALWLSLRCVEGFSRRAFAAQHGYDPVPRHHQPLARLRQRGLLCFEEGDDRVRLSEAGVLFADEVAVALI